MPRKKSPPTVSWDQPRFAGKTFAFAGKWSRWESERAEWLVEGDGGKIVTEVTPDLDFLAIGPVGGKTTLAGKKAEKLNAAGEAQIRILTQQELWDLFVPDRALALALLRAGPRAEGRLQLVLGGRRQAAVDLSGADLRGVTFPEHVILKNVNLAGADLSQADLSKGWFKEIHGARLDGARFPRGWLDKLSDCQAIGADLSGCRLYNLQFERCDFTRANLENGRLERLKTTAVVFHAARMSRADLEKAHLSGADLSEADLSKARLGECDLSGANLSGADLSEADLTRANLKGADLRNARLRAAILSDADLTDTNIDGADFEGANLAGAKLDGLDLTRARGFGDTPAAAKPTAGPHLKELDQVAGQAARLAGGATIVLPDDTSVPVSFLTSNGGKKIRLLSPKRNQWGQVPVASLSAGLLDLVRPYLHGTLRLDSIKATASGVPRKPKELRELVQAAWCEACGRPVPSETAIETESAAARKGDQERLERLTNELRQGAAGVKRWNALAPDERKKAGPFTRLDLSGAQLAGVNFHDLEFDDANFEKASLVGADLGGYKKLVNVRFREARLDRAILYFRIFNAVSFEGASLREANLCHCRCRGGCFKGADLTEAEFTQANLKGTDLSGATLTGTYFNSAEFDEKTLFPPGFVLPKEMTWRGKGQDPRWKRPAAAATPPSQPAEPLAVEQFMTRLRGKVDPRRLDNALQMLKAERFHLFSQVEEGSLVGVIKSQRDPDLVYSCRLAADGSFSCCTQNLRICGGLKGRICKHLLVLIVGLANSGKVNLGAVDQWISSSRGQRPVMDNEATSAVFLRYKSQRKK